jgi:hypothetical protein
MNEQEVKAYNYFYIVEHNFNDLSNTLWVDYITTVNNVTGSTVKVRKCVRRLKQAHAQMSNFINAK